MLFGRGAECAALDGLLAAARTSSSGVLVLRGEPGVGKSALCDYAAEHAAGMRVLRSAGIETEVPLPFATLHQVLHPVRDQLHLLPTTQATALRGVFGAVPDRTGDPFLVAVAALTLLGEVAAGTGLLCLVDDAHWMDPASAEALRFVARRVEAEGVAIVFAARDGDAAGEFRADGLPQRLVTGLDTAAARALLAESAPGLTEQVCARLVAGTAGNPLALLELPATLTADQLAGRETLPVPLTIGSEVEQLFIARVRQLSPPAQHFLLVAAAESTGDLPAILRAGTIAGIPEGVLDESERAGLVNVRDGRLRFRHPLVRSAIYHLATFLDRRSVHVALGHVLTDPADADRRAWHQAAAALEPDAELAAALEDSANRARARGGAATAADALVRSAQLSPSVADRAARYVAAAADAWQAGQWQRVPTLLDAAEPVAESPEVRARLWFLRGMLELRSGQPDTAYHLLLRSAATPANGSAMETLVHAGEAAALLGEPALADEVERLAGAVVGAGVYAGVNAGVDAGVDEAAPDEVSLVGLLSGWASIARPDWSAGAPLLAEAIGRVRGSDSPTRQLWAGRAALYLGDVAAAHTCYGSAVALARASGAVGELPMMLDRLAFADILSGRIAAATANAVEGLRLADALGLDSGIALVSLALAAAWTGDEDGCRAAAERAHGLAATRRLRMVAAGADWALGLLDLGAGRPADACARLLALCPGGRSDHLVIRLWATPDLVEAAVRSGSPADCEPAVAELARWAAGSGLAVPAAALRRCRGLLGGDDPAAEFGAAVDLDPQGDRPLERARAELLLGEALRRARRRSESRVHLHAALEGFERAGATPWAARTATELRASGETARTRELGAQAALTPQERQIARFAGEGVSNPDIAARLFLSRRTVEYHLHKVFTKLSLASRTELAGYDLDNR
ncbi:MAG TPA: LuxR family transcriptional regulator [Actinophytocola sp.]|nr:LuxR family transcriptional regulator [Actinophytocola sp.]